MGPRLYLLLPKRFGYWSAAVDLDTYPQLLLSMLAAAGQDKRQNPLSPLLGLDLDKAHHSMCFAQAWAMV